MVSNIIWKFRVLFFYFVIIIISLVFLPVLYFIKYTRFSYKVFYKACRLYALLFIYLAKYICGLNFIIEGIENLPQEKSLLLSNHQSFWDNLFIPAFFPMQSWIFKKELLDIPLFGSGLKMTNHISIDRNSFLSVKDIILQGIEKFKSGLWVVIFPEGTRLLPNQNRAFKPSGVRLAKTAKVPIVMLAHNAGLFWPKGFWIKQPGTIRVVVSKPISQKEVLLSDTRLLNKKTEDWINKTKNLLSSKSVI